jgi:hypothetical protein
MQLTQADRWWTIGLMLAAGLTLMMLAARACGPS